MIQKGEKWKKRKKREKEKRKKKKGREGEGEEEGNHENIFHANTSFPFLDGFYFVNG